MALRRKPGCGSRTRPKNTFRPLNAHVWHHRARLLEPPSRFCFGLLVAKNPFRCRPLIRAAGTKCGMSPENVVRRPGVFSLNGKSALIPSLDAGAQDGNVWPIPFVTLRIWKTWPTLWVSWTPGCVHWPNTGTRRAGTRIGRAGGCRILIRFGLIPRPTPGLPKRMPPWMNRRPTRMLQNGRITGVVLEELSRANFRGISTGKYQRLRGHALRVFVVGFPQTGDGGTCRPDLHDAFPSFRIRRVIRGKLLPRRYGTW